jgi:copper chaperone CopZ
VSKENTMTHAYKVTGMTCAGCEEEVKNSLLLLPGVTAAEVSKEKQTATISMAKHISLSALQNALGKKYSITVSEPGHQHSHHEHAAVTSKKEDIMKLAVSATLHCLLGCGIGEVAGMIIATYLGWSMIDSVILAVSLGFVFGFALGVIPLIKKGFSFSRSFKIVLVAEGLSIAVMEAFEVLTQAAIPGVMEAGLKDGIFWLGMAAALLVGFIAALPVNYYMIKRGVRHQH